MEHIRDIGRRMVKETWVKAWTEVENNGLRRRFTNKYTEGHIDLCDGNYHSKLVGFTYVTDEWDDAVEFMWKEEAEKELLG